MKKTLLFLGTIAVSAVTSGVTVWAVDRSHTDKIEYIEREVERTPALGSHFTAYEADKYPDLTYAAENAVKAVVNIEAIQQVDVSSGYGGGATDLFSCANALVPAISKRAMTAVIIFFIVVNS